MTEMKMMRYAEQERQMCRVMPMTARVSLESNHVDMRRDWVVEGNLSGGPSLADSYPAARESNNGPNAANDLRTNHHSNLRHSAWETRLRSISSSVLRYSTEYLDSKSLIAQTRRSAITLTHQSQGLRSAIAMKIGFY